MKYVVIKIERKDSRSFEVYARLEGYIQSPDIFLVQKDGELLKASIMKSLYRLIYKAS